MVEHITLEEEWNELLLQLKFTKGGRIRRNRFRLSRKTVDKELQKKWFIRHIEAAIELNL